MMNLTVAAQTTKSLAKDFKKLLDENRMFELRDAYASDNSALSAWDKLYFEAYIDNAFGKLAESNKAIDQIFSRFTSNFSRKQLIGLISCSADNYSKQHDYRAAADATRRILDKYGKVLGKKQREEAENMFQIWSSLSSVPPQRVDHSTASEVPIARNQFNHWIVPVKHRVESESAINFVMDTGANISTIRKKVADEIDVIITGSDINIGNSVGTFVKAEIGYLPRFYVGDLLVENMVFLVFPDEILSFPQINYQIDGIIGFPVMRDFGEFSISKEGVLKISPEPSQGAERNLFTSGLTPFVRAVVGGENLTLICDTGALSSHLSRRYYQNHRASMSAHGKEKVNMGGAGSSKTFTNRVITDFMIEVASRNFTLPQINIVQKRTIKFKDNDGFMGQDILLEPQEVVMNFRDMYLFFRD